MGRLKITKGTYQRPLSREEAEERFLLVTKDARKIFPPLNFSFELNIGDRAFKARIEAESCTCMGPEKPHEHYYLEGDYKDKIVWEKGRMIKVTKKSGGQYTLSQR